MDNEILRMEGISKAFPGVKALDEVNFNVLRGEVLALVGENGAGKSTLMKILSGIYQKDQGKIFFDGREAVINSPRDAQELGICIIHQELNLMENMDISENIFMGNERRKSKFFVDKNCQVEFSRKLLERVGLDVDPKTLVKSLSIAQRQMVEIARSLAFNAKMIIMDEPTSSLTDHEIERLKEIIAGVCAEGVSVVFISHRMDEVLGISQRITVLRDGCTIDTLNTAECERDQLIALMVGREISDIFPKFGHELKEEALRVESISTQDLLKDIAFSVRKGEILGFSGLVGSGRTELMNVIFGLDKATDGAIYIDGQKANIKSAQDAIKVGIGFVPEDRKKQGLILGMAVRENVSLPSLRRLVKGLFVHSKSERDLAWRFIKRLDIRTPSEEQSVRNLSGGNQQKIVLSKWLAIHPSILILDEPTRGVDVGAKKEIHSIINDLASSGMAVIMISSELPEILGMSDRIIVMHKGQVKGELSRAEATQESIMQLAVS